MECTHGLECKLVFRMEFARWSLHSGVCTLQHTQHSHCVLEYTLEARLEVHLEVLAMCSSTSGVVVCHVQQPLDWRCMAGDDVNNTTCDIQPGSRCVSLQRIVICSGNRMCVCRCMSM